MKSGKKSGLGWQAVDKILPQKKYKQHIKPKIRNPARSAVSAARALAST
ncbi:hypothetical protein AAFM71_09555 [Chromobacterium violaceum]